MPKMTWRRKALIVAVVCAAGLAFGWWTDFRFRTSGETEVRFLDVGQGDAAMIRSKDKSMLIDGGPDGSILEGLAAAIPWWRRRIDVMLVTHLDADHFVGFFGVLKAYDVKEVWWTGVAPNTKTARAFVAAVEAAKIPQHFARAGDRVDLGGGESFDVLFPSEDLRGRIVPKTTTNALGGGTNDYGIVGAFECGKERALFTADISSHVEARLIEEGAPIRAEVLKVPHHGSRYSSSEAFLDAVHPRDAVISVGAGNSYGHPTARVLEALLARGIRIFRTDRDGTVAYRCGADGILRKE